MILVVHRVFTQVNECCERKTKKAVKHNKKKEPKVFRETEAHSTNATTNL